ncbi:MAG TPA: twin transmembrane helix small protein [Alphaproteobacteria bacterium]|nr:twin transmembrane helix small protein [Alphaproteobacteria bacterium]
MSEGMNTAFTVMIGVAALATLAVVFIGVINMSRKGHDPRTSNKLMRWRIILQAVAIGLIVLFLLIAKR